MTVKTKTTRTKAPAAKAVAKAPAKAATASVKAVASKAVKTETTKPETSRTAEPVANATPDVEMFKMPEFNFGDMKMFDFSKFEMPKFDMSQFDISKFDVSNLEVPAAYRDLTEKALEQTKEGYAKAKAAAEDAVDVVEETLETARDTALEAQMKTVDNAKANTDAVYDFWKDMFSVKSASEAIELQTSFGRQQFEMLSSQSKDLQELASKAVTAATKPSKEAFEKAMKAA